MSFRHFSRTLVLFSVLFCATNLAGQKKVDCLCSEEFTWTVNYLEKNLPAYPTQVVDSNRTLYQLFKSELQNQSENSRNKEDCYQILARYVEYFIDNHTHIDLNYPVIDESKKKKLKTFKESEIFSNRERIENTGPELSASDDISGLYRTSDSTYVIRIKHDPTKKRDYVGLIVYSKTALWEPGMVKMELNKNDLGGYKAFVYMKNHSMRYNPNYRLSGNLLGGSWYRFIPGYNESVETISQNVTYRSLSDSTSYLYIPSFSGRLYSKMQSFYRAIEDSIQSKPYLVIDVRNNGGGSDDNAYPLLKYMYDRPIYGDSVEVYVTEENIRRWEGVLTTIRKNEKDYGIEAAEFVSAELEEMKSSPLGKFILRSGGDTLIMDSLPLWPKKVVILQNAHCASSCETLLFWGKQSDKTTLMGSPSGGYVGYGEVSALNTPCFGFDLYTTMTRFKYQRQFELTGVPPDVELSSNVNWILEAQKFLEAR